MKYLLDVNALLALSHAGPHYARMKAWELGQKVASFHTCAITELGFIRVSMVRYKFDRATAEKALAYAKRDLTGYIDTLPPPALAAWCDSHGKTTDAYLCQLAAAHGMKLATFDTGITDKAATQIP
jgi:predicted nucleic acid-binding protein